VRFIDSLREETNKGRSIAAHCRAGIGRSSVTVASIMVRNGFNPDDAFHRITKARGLNVPDTPE
jgi:protein-tyrosine phosphatase